MATRKIQEERVQHLNDADARSGEYVLYWMQSSQRAEHNHGKIRYMSAGGLERKAKPEQYVQKVEKRIEAPG